VSYLMARLTVEKYNIKKNNKNTNHLNFVRLNSLAKF